MFSGSCSWSEQEYIYCDSEVSNSDNHVVEHIDSFSSVDEVDGCNVDRPGCARGRGVELVPQSRSTNDVV